MRRRLKPEIVSGLDILIVRELTGGVYFGEPKETTTLPNGEKRAVDTQVYTTQRDRTHRACRVRTRAAAGQARGLRRKIQCDGHGRAVARSGDARPRAEFPDVALPHMLADNCAMQLVRNPKQYDVIVTDNLFGDVLSDEAAQLTGSIGMLPSRRWARRMRRRAASPRSTNRFTAARRISPAKASPIPSPASSRWRWPALFLRPRGRCEAGGKRG